MSLDGKLLQFLKQPKKIKDRPSSRKWSKQAITLLVQRYRKIKRRLATLEAERELYQALEAACRRSPGSMEITQILATIDHYQHSTLKADPLRVGPKERKEMVEKAIKLQEQGKYTWEIAEQFGIAPKTLTSWLRRHRDGSDKYRQGTNTRTKLPE